MVKSDGNVTLVARWMSVHDWRAPVRHLYSRQEAAKAFHLQQTQGDDILSSALYVQTYTARRTYQDSSRDGLLSSLLRVDAYTLERMSIRLRYRAV